MITIMSRNHPEPPKGGIRPTNWQKQADHFPLGFGLRQSSGAFGGPSVFESGRGLPQSKTLSRVLWLPAQSDPFLGRL
jgi:hypothetical protein